MTNEVSSLSRVYKFLSQKADWAAEADGNGDGAITKAEFSKYLKENFEWNGEEDSQKTDLINSFWKSIDTNKSTAKIKGTRVRNNNALDKKEQEAMAYRLEMYETLNTFLDGIKAPTVLSSKYATQWKTSVDTSLSNITETAIKGKKTTEELQALLEEQTPLVQAKATADYCATEYLETTMKTISQKYSYAYGDDNTLKGIIDAYVQSLHGDETATDMQSDIQDIIDAYLATAGLADDNGVDLEQYGYVQNDGSELNDLQKCVAKKALQDNLASIKDEADYADYSSYYDEAVNAYIESVLSSATFATFDEIQTYGVEQFKATDEYATVTTKVKTKKLLASDALREKISSTLSSELADNIQKNGRYISAFDEITNQAIEKAANGEFDTNGTLDEEKLLNWVVDQVSARLTEFYPNGLKSMTVKTLKSMYTTLTNAASKETDNEKSLTQYRNAALQVCEALYNKGDKFKEAVVEVFGESYTKTINASYPSDIDEMMQELLDNVSTLGDISEMTNDEKKALSAGIKSHYLVIQGISLADSLKLPTSATCNGTTVTSDRIKYSATGNLKVDENGNITLDSSKTGTYTGKITISIDGEKITSKTVSITVIPAPSFDNLTDTSGGHLEVYNCSGIADDTQVRNADFAQLYNGNAIIQLVSGGTDGDWNEFGARGDVKSRIASLLDLINKSLVNAGLDATKLNKAVGIVLSEYSNEANWTPHRDRFDGGRATYCANKMQENAFGYTSPIVKQQADIKGHKDKVVYMTSFRKMVDRVLEEYNKL